MKGCTGTGGAGQVEGRRCRQILDWGLSFPGEDGGLARRQSSYLGVVLLRLLGRGGGCGGLLPAKKVDAIVEADDRRTNMIVRKKRRAGDTRSSHIKQMERRFDQEARTVDEDMGGEVERFDPENRPAN